MTRSSSSSQDHSVTWRSYTQSLQLACSYIHINKAIPSTVSCIDVHPTVFSTTPSVAKIDHGQKRDDDPLGY